MKFCVRGDDAIRQLIIKSIAHEFAMHAQDPTLAETLHLATCCVGNLFRFISFHDQQSTFSYVYDFVDLPFRRCRGIHIGDVIPSTCRNVCAFRSRFGLCSERFSLSSATSPSYQRCRLRTRQQPAPEPELNKVDSRTSCLRRRRSHPIALCSPTGRRRWLRGRSSKPEVQGL
jgi:hypothetical protein